MSNKMTWLKCKDCEFRDEITTHDVGIMFMCRVTAQTYRLTTCKYDIPPDYDDGR